MGTYYRDFSSAPRWVKTLKTTGKGSVFLFLWVVLFGVLALGGHGLILAFIFFILMSNLLDCLYGKPCASSRKGQPWVIEFNDDHSGFGGGGGGDGGGGGCGGGGCGGD